MSLREDLYAAPDTWTEEIEALLEAFSADYLDVWEVYERRFKGRPWENAIASSEQHRQIPRYNYPSNSVHLAYLPESIAATDWIGLTNGIEISHETSNDYEFDIDTDDDQKQDLGSSWRNNRKEAKYVVRGTFVEPIITRSVERVVDHVESEMERVAAATEFNAELERLSNQPTLFPDEDPPEDPSEFTEQRSPVTSVKGVGSTSVKRLAKNFGTYYNVTVGDARTIGKSLSSWHRPSPPKVIEAIDEVLNRYNRFRKLDDWNRTDIPPDTWTDYPKDQPW